MKTCKVCQTAFEPKYNTMQKVCSVDCARDYAKLQRHTEHRAETRKRRRELNMASKSYVLKKCQETYNKYVRKRGEIEQKGLCISCGRRHQGQYHAGHFITVKSGGNALRFHPFNAWLQCQPCNTHLSGNLLNYRKGLIKIIGEKNVEWLEGYHAPQKLTIDEINEIREFYRQKLKYLEDENVS